MNTEEQNDYTASLSVAHDRKDLAWRDRRRWYRRTCALGTEAVGDHVTCYYAGLAGIPLAVVQSIVGHMSPEMTKHYSAHASIEDRRRGMERLSFFTQDALPEAKADEPERIELRQRIETLPIDTVRAVLQFLNAQGMTVQMELF